MLYLIDQSGVELGIEFNLLLYGREDAEIVTRGVSGFISTNKYF